MNKSKYQHESDDPKYRHEHFQDVFRRQAQKKINATKRQLDMASFAKIQKNALSHAVEHLKKTGVIDENGCPINKTHTEAKEIFNIFYENYLEIAKRNQNLDDPTHLLDHAFNGNLR